jgi:hypothetical protein
LKPRATQKTKQANVRPALFALDTSDRQNKLCPLALELFLSFNLFPFGDLFKFGINLRLFLFVKLQLGKAALVVNSDCRWMMCYVISSSGGRSRVGLKDDQGQWISVTEGCYLGSQPVMLLQMNNDQEFERLSLSLVLRAYLIEDFIQKGASELVFWAGAGSILGRYCVYARALAVSLDKQGHGWRLTRYLISLLAPRMPRDLARDLQFVAGGEAGGRHLRAGLV